MYSWNTGQCRADTDSRRREGCAVPNTPLKAMYSSPLTVLGWPRVESLPMRARQYTVDPLIFSRAEFRIEIICQFVPLLWCLLCLLGFSARRSGRGTTMLHQKWMRLRGWLDVRRRSLHRCSDTTTNLCCTEDEATVDTSPVTLQTCCQRESRVVGDKNIRHTQPLRAQRHSKPPPSASQANAPCERFSSLLIGLHGFTAGVKRVNQHSLPVRHALTTENAVVPGVLLQS